MGRTGLSDKEMHRVEVLGRVKAGSMGLREAGELMGVSYRQMKRIWGRYQEGGAKAVRHRACGRGSNRGYSAAQRERIIEFYRQRYVGFGPTLASEHLGEEGMRVGRQTLARWLRESGLWSGVRKRKPYRHRCWLP